jgi:hypothetical protein
MSTEGPKWKPGGGEKRIARNRQTCENINGWNSMAHVPFGNMNYYEKLVSRIEKSMEAHPRSTLVMDTGSFKIIAKGRDFKSASRKLRASAKPRGVAVVFRKPQEDAVWIL